MVGKTGIQLVFDGRRIDGRAFDELRPIKISAGVLANADGSAYVELGKNKILAAVYGPREVVPRHDTDPYKAIVRCRYMMAPFSSLEEHGRSGPNRRSMEISKVISEAFDGVILTETYPKTAIDVFIEVLEGNGSTRVAGVVAAAVALANAGIPMKDVIVGISAGKVDGHIVVDLVKEEDNYGQADMPIAIAPHTGNIHLLQMDGKMTREEFAKALDMAFEGAEKIRVAQVEALKAAFESTEKEVEEGSKGNGGSGTGDIEVIG